MGLAVTITNGTPYFYRQRESGIFIIRILHQQMQPMRHFSEL